MEPTIVAAIIGGAAAIAASVIPVYLKRRSSPGLPPRATTARQSISNTIEIDTWGGKAKFKYEGSVKGGTKMYFGKSSSAEVTSEQYQKLLNEFKGKTVNVASSFTSSPAKGTLEEWLQNNVTKVSISTYVAAILKNESYAVRNKSGQIEFDS